MTAVDAEVATDVEFVGVHKRIGERSLLRDLTLAIGRGQRVALIGPSGAGKTTLLRLCAGVLWPSDGDVRVLGKATGTLHGRELCRLRQQVGVLHQQENLVPGLRVAHNVLIGRLGKWPLWKAAWSLLRPQELERAQRALGSVELAARLWALPEELSGGEQQRVAIARLLLQEPRILLADEPASSLDIRLGREVVQLLLALAGPTTTVIVSLHTLDLLRLPFDRILALRDGELVFDGPPASLTRDDLRAIYGEEYRTLRLDQVQLGPERSTEDTRPGG
ncbi:MAG: ATP-binding cassette domain-containing protein [Planctomycetota bacterium]